MKGTYDEEADAVYLELAQTEFDHNKELDEDTVIDFDKQGRIIGIEILNAHKRFSKEALSSLQTPASAREVHEIKS